MSLRSCRYKPGAMKAHNWYITTGSAIMKATNMVTFMGTKNEPVTSVTIILPPTGSAFNKGWANRWNISGAQYTKPINTTMMASPDLMTRSRNSNKWERNDSCKPSLDSDVLESEFELFWVIIFGFTYRLHCDESVSFWLRQIARESWYRPNA